MKQMNWPQPQLRIRRFGVGRSWRALWAVGIVIATGMKKAASIALVAIVGSLLVGCVAYSTYNNLDPITPKPHSVRIYAPVSVDSLRPVFRWRVQSADQKADLAIWEAVYRGTGLRSSSDSYDRGALVYYRERISGGTHQMETNLAPATIYFWSVKPTGTMNWSTANHTAVISVLDFTQFEHSKGLFFSIKTRKE